MSVAKQDPSGHRGRGSDALPRREFLGRSARAAAGGLLPCAIAAPRRRAAGRDARKSKVVVVTSGDAMREDAPDHARAAVVEAMLGRGICEVAGRGDPRRAWRTFFRRADSVAVCDAGAHLQNLPELTVAALKGLAVAGVRAMKLGSIYVAWRERIGRARADRWIGSVKQGLEEARIPGEVIDPALYRIPARFAVDPFDALLVVCTLKPHYLCGVSGVVKHFATLSKGGPRAHHPDAMVTAGSVLATDFAAHRKLVVVDALRFARTGDPHRPARDYVFPKALILSTDPVAADTVALDMFLASGCRPQGAIPPRIHIEAANRRYRAGESDPERIEVRRIRL